MIQNTDNKTHVFSPSLISLMVSVDVKHHVYFSTYMYFQRCNIFFSGVKITLG